MNERGAGMTKVETKACEEGDEIRRTSVSSALEQERVYPRCDRCNNKLTDSDWSKLKSEGWVFGIVKHCSPCIDSMARALAQSTRPHEFTDVE